jgi:MFS transporter, DHA2 family, multidrug resistance protein
VIFAIVAWMRSAFNTDVDIWTLVWPTVLQGAAVSCFFIPLVALVLGGLRQDQIAAASGLNNFLRITAGGFATSIATTLWESRAALHHARIVERLTPYDPAATGALQSLGALGMAPEQQYAFLNQMVNRQAFTLSALDLFYGSALLLVILIPLLWIARPPRQQTGPDAAAAH